MPNWESVQNWQLSVQVWSSVSYFCQAPGLGTLTKIWSWAPNFNWQSSSFAGKLSRTESPSRTDDSQFKFITEIVRTKKEKKRHFYFLLLDMTKLKNVDQQYITVFHCLKCFYTIRQSPHERYLYMYAASPAKYLLPSRGHPGIEIAWFWLLLKCMYTTTSRWWKVWNN